jgi:hypothetical protein
VDMYLCILPCLRWTCAACDFPPCAIANKQIECAVNLYPAVAQ